MSQKRNPKYKSKRPLPFIEQKITELRKQGNNKYEISCSLKPKLNQFIPSPSGVYIITKGYVLKD